MGVGLKIGNGWMYLLPKEKININKVIKSLDNLRARQAMISSIAIDANIDQEIVSHCLYILLACKIVRVEQHSRARLFSLLPNWRERLVEITTYYGKDLIIHNNKKDGVTNPQIEKEVVESG
jgi:hypothetical protein